MNGARFVRDRLELAGWQGEIADPQKGKRRQRPTEMTGLSDALLMPVAELPLRALRAEDDRVRRVVFVIGEVGGVISGRLSPENGRRWRKAVGITALITASAATHLRCDV